MNKRQVYPKVLLDFLHSRNGQGPGQFELRPNLPVQITVIIAVIY